MLDRRFEIASTSEKATNETLGLRRDVLLALPEAHRPAALRAALRHLVARPLRLEPSQVPTTEPLTRLGLDSLAAVEIQHRLEEYLEAPVTAPALLEGIGLDDLAGELLATLEQPREAPRPTAGTAALRYPLSEGQKALWYLHRLAPASGAYQIPAAARVTPALERGALRRALGRLAERHGALRTVVGTGGEIPFQSVATHGGPEILELEAASWSEAELAETIAREAYRPFDLERGPVARVVLLRSGAEEDVILLVVHHIVADFWSLTLLARELGALYAEEAGGAPAGLEPLAWNFADYVRWQRELLAGPRGVELLEFWRRELAGPLPTLDLPTDRPRPPVESYRGATRNIRLVPELAARIEGLARSGGATLFTVLLAVFQALLHRLSGQREIQVGSPVAGRSRPELAELVGYLTGPVVLRAEIERRATFAVLLGETRRRVLRALAHQDYPFPLLAERLQVERDPSRSPIFQAMFVMLKAPRPEDAALAAFGLGEGGARIELGGHRFESIGFEERASQFDVTLRAAEIGGEIVFSLQYNSDLFDATTAFRMLSQLRVLVSGGVADPQTAVGELPLLSPGQEHQLRREWSDATAAVDRRGTIHGLFEASAALSPDAEALVFEDRQWTYGDLDRRANRLARHLRRLGVGPEVPVGLFVERGPEMLVGALGILKAGGAYLPLDPSYPADRLLFMAKDCGAPVVVTSERLADRLPGVEAHLLRLDADGAEIGAESGDAPPPASAGLHLAYVIYTSGSTGRPKGVLIEHRSVLNFFRGMDRAVGCDASDTLLAVTSISFDISVLELFWTLARGARVVLLAHRAASELEAEPAPGRRKRLDFSLFYFASDPGEPGAPGYRLLLDGARFADRHDYRAIWTPERHFHAFGGLYPNPSVTSAALATITERLELRAGSVVLPLHDPIRVAEEWSVVDNLSKGRVGIAFASGWHADDFVFFPEHYEERKDLMFRQIETVERLWRGEAVTVRGGAGNRVEVRILPRPVQARLPIWITAAGSEATFVQAGERGANILTHLLGQSLEEVAQKVRAYRDARAAAGHDPASGTVTLMLHTFVGERRDEVREVIRAPFTNYLRSSVGLIRNLARSARLEVDFDQMSAEDMDELLAFAFDRYYETSALFGDRTTCARFLESVRDIDVDEVACLIDFGVEPAAVMRSLERLEDVRRRLEAPSAAGRLSLTAAARRWSPTLFQSTPSMMSMLAADPASFAALGSLRAALLGGEALPAELARQVRGALPGRLVNVYGPTETTIWSSSHEVTDEGGPVPIGRPIANTDLHVVDAGGRLAAPAVEGELRIGGAGVARGYLDRPRLSAERFVPDPFSDRPGARLYRTGDRVRRRRDGVLDFLGRLDQQLKIRGFRVEPGEIESALGEHPDLREAAVVVDRRATGGVRLVAYVVPRGPSAPSVEALRGHLAQRLPDYMVPQVFVPLAAMPRTPNRKIDRRALPDPGAARPDLASGYVAPASALEKRIAEIWQEVLGVDRVGRHDNFFALGGHSLVATQVLTRMQNRLRLTLPVRALLESPTVAGLVAQLEARGVELRGEDLDSIPVADRRRPLALSFAQQRIWLIHHLAPESAAYNDPYAVRLTGALEVPLLAAAFREVIRRHEILRATFESRHGEPVQVIDPDRPVELPRADLSGLAGRERAAELERRILWESRQPFDLAHGPLMRLGLLVLGAEEVVLLVTLHHVISDGWSMEILVEELLTIYRAFIERRPSPLPELPVQYADFAAWQRRLLSGERLAESMAFWKELLTGGSDDGRLGTLELPTDRPRPRASSFRGSHRPFSLPDGVSRSLAERARRGNTTLFATLLASFAALLHRYSGQDEFLLGTPIAGRTRLELEPLIGFFVNTLVLRMAFSGEPAFDDLLAEVRTMVSEAHAHQEVPFERLVEELQPDRSLNQTPLFNVLFKLQNTPRWQGVDGLRMEMLSTDTRTAAFDLDMTLEAGEGDRLSGSLRYSTDLFDATTIIRLLRHFEVLLRGVIEAPERPLSVLPLVSAPEAHQLLTEWDATAEPFRDLPVQRLFEEAARRDPRATALRFRQQPTTYGDLDAESNRLARGLLALVPKPRRPMAVMVETGPDQITALLAVLKAGLPFVALDAELPSARLRAILAEAVPEILVTDAGSLARRRLLVDEAVEEWGPRVAVLDAEAGDLPGAVGPDALFADRAASPLELAVAPKDPIYVVYTSGSTGHPKGIVQSHRSFSQFIQWQSRTTGVGPGRRVAAWASITYDASYCEIFGALCFGATLCLAEKAVRFDPSKLLDWIGEERFTWLQIVPTYCRQLTRAAADAPAAAREALARLGHLLLAGEALSASLVETWREQVGGATEIFNFYGPTESVLATFQRLDAAALRRRQVPIGRAIDGRQILVLNQRGALCPMGVQGEILVRSRYLTLGYFERPAETARAFVQNPRHDTFADPVYLTGDIGRWLPDGRLEFGGRRDHQVKVRGMRVELGEIEAVVSGFDEVAECAVAWQRFQESEPRLVAYLVAAPDGARRKLEIRKLRDELRELLPEHMVPANFVVLDELPRTRSGKLDRRALVESTGLEGRLGRASESLVADLLSRHEAVEDCAVTRVEQGPGDEELVAYVVAERAIRAFDEAHVARYEDIYDEVYRERQRYSEAEAGLNLRIWVSSYTGEPFADEEIREGVDDIVARILSLTPRHVLEIGCGSGLLLFRIGDRCESYVGTDVSEAGLNFLEHELARRPLALPEMELLHRAAHDFTGLEDRRFDTVIINDVAIYFPSLEYLIEVIGKALSVLAPGGTLYLGGMRSLPLQRAFHTSVILHQAPEETPVDELLRRIDQRLDADKELVVDPALFLHLHERLPSIDRVRIELKEGRHHNEVSLFQYDVFLHIAPSGGERDRPAEARWIDWRRDGLTPAVLRGLLERERPEALGVTGVPNGRLTSVLRDLEELGPAPGDRRVTETADPGADPQELWDWREALPYEVSVGWMDGRLGQVDGSYRALFRRRHDERPIPPADLAVAPPPASEAVRDWRLYANHPVRVSEDPRLAGELRDHLAASLPRSLVPAAFMFLETLPRKADGEVDRTALPLPEGPWLDGEAQRGEGLEAEIAALWRDVLGCGRIGPDDNFFELGGHSLLGVQVVSRVQESFAVQVPLAALFEAPTLESFAEAVGRRMAEGWEGQAAPPLPEIERVARDGELPLSFAQRRLWFLFQVDPRSAAYSIPTVVRLSGDLDVAVLQAGLDEIVRRHETLRTTFVSRRGVPRQMIAPAGRACLTVVDLWPRGGEEEALELVRPEARRPFDLVAGPLLRCLLIKVEERRHLALLNVHHIISDGWSMGVLIRELNALYGAFLAGHPSPLPELPVQYADFAAWQRRWLRGRVLEAQMDFWRRQLQGEAGLPPVIELPSDRPRPAVQSFCGATHFFRMAPPLADDLGNLSRQRGATLFMSLSAVFYALLHRYTGQRDVTVGTPVAGRRHRHTEDLIGFFVNALALRLDLSGDPPVDDLLGRVKDMCLKVFAHQDLPFEKLVSELAVDRDLSRSPLFQIVFALQNVMLTSLEAPGLVFELLDVDTGSAKFDVALAVAESDGGFSGNLEYSTDLFDESTVRRLLVHFSRLLAAAAERPAARISELSMLSAGELTQILRDWNDTVKHCPQAPMVHELFAGHAKRRPEAVAFVAQTGHVLTYGELDARSNRLAHHLRRLGVAPEVLVAMCTDRTPERAVGILGAVKAGGGYVSIDPTHPRDRIAFLLEDARAPIILTEERFREALPESRARVISLDAEWQTVDGDEIRPPEAGLTPDHLVYVVYTSGSTGRPKGVAIPHAGLMNLVRWHQDLYGVEPGDRGTQVASPAFDASVWEFWPYLTGGASLHVPDDERRLSSVGMMDFWRQQRITLAYLMTPLAEGILEQEVSAEPDWRVRALIIGGDRLHHRSDPRLGFRLMNHYGPAEYSVTSTVGKVAPRGASEGVPTIGRAVDNTAIHLLDRRGRPVPVGVPGELFVAGIGLARAYLRRPQLTAEKFLPNPFGGRSGARIYKTGDLVRWLPDGDLDFLGRLDHQVKIRGLRIELGEIESVLDQHPGVREAIVLVREEGTGRKRLIAYWVPASEAALPVEALDAFLKERLPSYMVPAVLVELPRLPLTPNGKIDRDALEREPLPDSSEGRVEAPETPMEKRVAGIWADVLGLEQVSVDERFFDLGGDSLLLVRLQSRLAGELGAELKIAELFQYPSVRALSKHLAAQVGGLAEAAPGLTTRFAQRSRRLGRSSGAVAIIGMAGRFPKAASVGEFWLNLCAGVEGIVDFSKEELLLSGNDPEVVEHPFYVPALGYLDDADCFDAGFFGYSPREAQLMDPQHRLFLESAHAALEDAGHGDVAGSSVGVFAGTSMSAYIVNLFTSQEHLESLAGRQAAIGNDKDQLATRVSYQLGLRGPSFTVQTACSTSLVATHLACQSLLNGECDMALAGGVSVPVPLKQGYVYEESGIRSPDGRCRAFDAEAAGTAIGAGVGVVVLKRLEEAAAAGDAVYAVILGTAINNDGAGKVGYTAPSVEGQAEVIAEAQDIAGVDPESIGYVEAHGTGTKLGDPVEIAGLTRAFRRRSSATGYCAVGSVKTNIGHLDAAAGVAGLIKTALAIDHGLIPPSLHYQRPNPEIDFPSSPFYVNTSVRPWPSGQAKRRAGVSSFGIGGTNAHAVLEQAPDAEPSARPAASRPWRLLPLSARTEAAAARRVEDLARLLRTRPDLDPEDVAWTLQAGRQRFPHRRMVVCRDLAEAVRALETGEVSGRHDGADERSVAFLFSGLGPQYVGMGRELYENEELFRREMDQCAEIAARRLGLDLLATLYPDETRREEAARRLDEIAVMLPALFSLEYALARLWMSWGIEPAAMIGHSNGEYTAACLAGVFSLEDALTLVGARSRLMQSLPPEGAMLVVPLSPAEIEPELAGEMSVATVNAPDLSVVAGPAGEVEALEARLLGQGLECQRLRADRAYHSAMMNPLIEPFVECVAAVERRAPKIPFVSNVTGDWITDGQARNPRYWGRHLRSTVRFADGVARLTEDQDRILLEVGPGAGLANLARRQAEDRLVLSSLRGRKESGSDLELLVRTLGRLWMAGARVDWLGFHGRARRRRVHLPTYPFERSRYWIERARTGTPARPASRKPLDEWTYIPSWKRMASLEPPGGIAGERHWLLFAEPQGLGAALAEELARRGQSITTVEPGARFERLAPGRYRLDPACRDDFARLIDDLDRRPDEIVHLWTATDAERLGLDRARNLGFDCLLHLAQALATPSPGDAAPVGLQVVANGLHEVVTGDAVEPGKALILGLLKVLPQELPQLRCRSLDLGCPAAEAAQRAERLLAEIAPPIAAEVTLAWRGRHRWVQSFEPLPLPAAARPSLLRRGGVYLITGGLGNLGRLFAQYLFDEAAAKLVFTGRTVPPSDREAWSRRGNGDRPDAGRMRFLMDLEARGAQFLALQADVSDRRAMARVFAETRKRFGKVHGVIHAAGDFNPELIQQMQPEDVERVFAAKLEGSLVLSDLLGEGERPDFLLFCSSLASVVGGIGLGAYSAVNAFMDALSFHNESRGGPRTISVNWGFWQFADEVEERAFHQRFGEAFRQRRQTGMRPSEGLEVLARILSHPLPQIAVSTRDLAAELSAVEELRHAREAERSAGGSSRPNLDTPYVAPRDDLEECLVGIWQELIGVERVGTKDNFYELGGHSLLATQIASRVRDQLGVEMPLDRMLAGPTVAEMAEVIAEIQAATLGDEADLAEMLAEIQEMPQAQLSALLNEEQGSPER